MSQIPYLGLEGVGDWFRSLPNAEYQLDPYLRYLRKARWSLRDKKFSLEWRPATGEELENLKQSSKPSLRGTGGHVKRRKQRHRDYHINAGAWVILRDSEEPQESQDRTTEDEFLDAEFVWDDERCEKDSKIRVLQVSEDPPALLLERAPGVVEGGEDAVLLPAHLYLSPNTGSLDRQIRAIERLLNEPLPAHAPLVRLLSSRAIWPEFEPDELQEDEWCILTDLAYEGTKQQRQFVETALTTPDFALLEGPPGSGKTRAICELILQAARRGQRILLVASTHVAVDNVLEEIIEWRDDPNNEDLVLPVRIGDESKVESDEVKDFILKNCVQTYLDDLMDFLERPENVTHEAEPARQFLRDALVKESRDQSRKQFEEFLLNNTNLICGTTIGILKHPAMNSVETFDLMILDEASKTTFSEFLVPALHAKKWVVVGDIKQLAPYVDDGEFSSNLEGLLSEEDARICMNTFVASRGENGTPNSVLAAIESDDEKRKYIEQSVANGVPLADLDGPLDLSLLYSTLIVGKPTSITACEDRLPGDIRFLSGPVPQLAGFERHQAHLGSSSTTEESEWAKELGWRLKRNYELRQDVGAQGRYDEDISALMPAWDESGKTNSNLNDFRRVGLPSILELLQVGFEPHTGQREKVVLTHGLPSRPKQERLVSLKYQHRMHPEISRFSRKHFYSVDEDDVLPMHPDISRSSREHFHSEDENDVLLQDSRKAHNRNWGYNRYSKRAVWIDAKGRELPNNRNEVEAAKVMRELNEFLDWAMKNPAAEGGEFNSTYEVAVLTFYRGQEALLRGMMQEKFGHNAKRNFCLARYEKGTPPLVHATLCTVDRFQGHEADIVFLSFVKTHRVGFLDSPNRINVGLTRAKYQLVLLGDRRLFLGQQRSELLRQLALEIDVQNEDLCWRPES